MTVPIAKTAAMPMIQSMASTPPTLPQPMEVATPPTPMTMTIPDRRENGGTSNPVADIARYMINRQNRRSLSSPGVPSSHLVKEESSEFQRECDANSGAASAVAMPPHHTNSTTAATPTTVTMPPPVVRKEQKDRKTGDAFTAAKSLFPPIKVLIVEDNPINQTILSTFLRKRGIKYAVATNGMEAVDKWKEGGFHLVLMDIQLPVMDGIAATKEIRRLEKEKNIGIFSGSICSAGGQTSEALETTSTKSSATSASGSDQSTPSSLRPPVIIVALTASSLQSDRHAALAAGCNDFLTKPVSLVWLEKKIKEWGCMQALIDFEAWQRYRSDAVQERTGYWEKYIGKLDHE